MKCLIRFFVSFIIITSTSASFPQNNNLSELQFLIGEWVGSGGGANSGQGTGSSVFRYDLDSTIIIRENFAHYPEQNNKPEYTHKDIMMIFMKSGSPKALYIDNENHAINYNITFSGNHLIFTSEEIKGMPQFRLTYEKPEGDKMNLIFEIAPPASPGRFNKYLSAVMQKK
jgi:hypothetical protein